MNEAAGKWSLINKVEEKVAFHSRCHLTDFSLLCTVAISDGDLQIYGDLKTTPFCVLL